MNKASVIIVLIWLVLAVIFIVGQIVGATPFFVISNDIFAFFNGMIVLSTVIDYFKSLFKRKEIK